MLSGRSDDAGPKSDATSETPTVMESQRHVQQEENVGINGSGKVSGFLCRQSNTRWIPTAEQIRILRDLYYNKGLRSPNAEQIQRISARLRQYGKIEGKNVFYWFQNHKARERQKKRLAADHLAVQAAPSTPAAPDGWSTCEEASSKLTSIASSSINGNSSCCDSAVGAVVELGAARGVNLRVERGNDIRESEILCSTNKHVKETVVDSWYEFFCLKDSSETSDQTDGETETLQLFPLGSGNESDHGIDPKLELGRESQGTSWFSHYKEHDASLELTLKMIGGKKSERRGG